MHVHDTSIIFPTYQYSDLAVYEYIIYNVIIYNLPPNRAPTSRVNANNAANQFNVCICLFRYISTNIQIVPDIIYCICLIYNTVDMHASSFIIMAIALIFYIILHSRYTAKSLYKYTENVK